MGVERELTFGIDLGGTSTRVGLFDESMRLLASQSIPTRVLAGPQACVDEMSATMSALCRDHAATSTRFQLAGVGIGSPGPINLRTGVLGSLPNFPGWEKFPLRDALAEATKLPVTLECDANAAALAEWKLGAGAGSELKSLAMLTLGTGVGSGLILDGEVWHGMFGMGGEVGHSTVNPQGLVCGCGTRGCLEMYASANGLLRLARAMAETEQGTEALRALVAQTDLFTPREVARLADTGDAGAVAAYEKFGFYLGLGVANLVNTLDLPLIVIGGGVAAAWPLFAPAMFQSVYAYSLVYRLAAPTQTDLPEEGCTHIRPARLGAAAGLLGAALLPGRASSATADQAVVR